MGVARGRACPKGRVRLGRGEGSFAADLGEAGAIPTMQGVTMQIKPL